MNKKLKISLVMIVSVLIICCLAWWFLPVHFLRGIVPEEIAASNGSPFERSSLTPILTIGII